MTPVDSSSDDNDREQGLTDIGEIPWVHAIFEMEDTNIKVNGGNAMTLSSDDSTVQRCDKLL